MQEKIRKYALSKGAAIVGFARATDFSDAPEGFRPTDIMPSAQGVVVIGVALPQGVTFSPNAAVYTAQFSSTMPQLDMLAREIVLFIEEKGNQAMPVPADDPYFYWDDERKHGMGILSHRHAAVKAGLGVLGKNSLLITPEFGNRVQLVTILTDIRFEAAEQLADLCLENCRRCLDACPSQALPGNYSIEQKACREYFITKSARGDTLIKCWQCRAACPIGKK